MELSLEDVSFALILKQLVEDSFSGIVFAVNADTRKGLIFKEGPAIYAMFGLASPAFGIAVAFVSAVIAVKWMVAYLNRHGLEVFGYYRIALGLTVAGLMLGGMLG